MLHHTAILYPDRAARGRAVSRLPDHAYRLDRAEDRGATVSVSLYDPDGNGNELYDDRPREAWFDPHGKPISHQQGRMRRPTRPVGGQRCDALMRQSVLV